MQHVIAKNNIITLKKYRILLFAIIMKMKAPYKAVANNGKFNANNGAIMLSALIL